MPYYQVSVDMSEGLEPNQVTLTLKTTDAKTDAEVTACCDVAIEFPGFNPSSQPTYALTFDGVDLLGGCASAFLDNLTLAVADMFSGAGEFAESRCTGDCPGIGLTGSGGGVNIAFAIGYTPIECDPYEFPTFAGLKISAETSCADVLDFIPYSIVDDDDPLSSTYEFNAGGYVDMMGLRIKIIYSDCESEVEVPEKDCTYHAIYRNPWPWKTDDGNDAYLAEIIEHPPGKWPPKRICLNALPELPS